MTSSDPTLKPATLKDERRQFFFWLGVFVLPLFWSWFTLSKRFARRERVVAFVWLAVFVGWLVRQRGALMNQLETVSFVYPAILGWVTVALFVWLIFRAGFSVTPIEIFVGLDLLAVIQPSPSILFVDLVGQPFKWEWLLPACIAVLAHLALEPLQRFSIGRKGVRLLTPS